MYYMGNPDPPCARAILRGKWRPIVKCRDLMPWAVQKMAEPIEMPFEMLTEAQGRMYYTGPCPICTRAILRGSGSPLWSIGTFCEVLPSAVQNGWTDQDAIWCMDSGWPKKACVRWGRVNTGKYDWFVHMQQRCSLIGKLLWPPVIITAEQTCAMRLPWIPRRSWFMTMARGFNSTDCEYWFSVRRSTDMMSGDAIIHHNAIWVLCWSQLSP